MINETVAHDERGVYRAVTGQTSHFPKADGTLDTFQFPQRGTVPMARTFPGTIESDGKYVRGTDTEFTKGIKVGDYLYDDAAAVRMIRHIISDTLLELDDGFPVDVNGIDVLVCERQTFKMIIAESTGTGEAILQEAIFPVGSRVVHGGAPIAYDATSSNGQICFSVSQ